MAQLGRYTLLRRVGSGGMAEVWKAKAQGPAGFEKVVAVKRIPPHLVADTEFIDMFVEEAKIVARLMHPNIVQVFDFGVSEASDDADGEQSNYFITMEYVAGQNLAVVLKKREHAPVDEDVALYICKDTAKALAYASQEHGPDGQPMNIIHRDISPHNIMLSYRGEVKVTDFGIAKVTSALPRTAAGVWKGKIAYMSPEQATLQPLDHRSDLFCLGIVMYELLTGKRLFPGRTSEEIYARIQRFTTPTDGDLAELQPATREILTKVLQVDREDRYETGQHMADAILEALGTKGVLSARGKIRDLMGDLFSEEKQAEVEDLDRSDTGTEVDVVSGPQANTSLDEDSRKELEAAKTTVTPSDVNAQVDANETDQLAANPNAKSSEKSDVSGRTSEWMAAVARHEEGAQMQTNVENAPSSKTQVSVGEGGQQQASELGGSTQIASTRVSRESRGMKSGDTVILNRNSDVTRPESEVDQSIAMLKTKVLGTNDPDSSLPEKVPDSLAETKPLRTLDKRETVRLQRLPRPDETGLKIQVTPRNIVLLVLAVAVVVALAVLVARMFPGGNTVASVSPVPSPTPVVTTQVTTVAPSPSPVKVETPTPKPNTPKPIRTHHVVVTSRPRTPPATRTPTPTPVVTTPGKLTVKARPWCQVWVDGKMIAKETPLRLHQLPSGTHKLMFINPDFNFKMVKTVRVEPGRELELFVDVPKKTVERR